MRNCNAKSCRSPLLSSTTTLLDQCQTRPSFPILFRRLEQTSTSSRRRDISPKQMLPTYNPNWPRPTSKRPTSRPIRPSLYLSLITKCQPINRTLHSPLSSHSQPQAIPERELYGPTMRTEGCAVFRRSSSAWLLTLTPKEPNDLTMVVGDVIDIVEETNTDWWTGRNKGRQGLFPSNYVQKLPPEPSMQPQQEKVYGAPGYTNYGNHTPPQQPMNPVNNPPPVNSVGLQPDDGQDRKKNKFGKFGNTVRPFLLLPNRPH